MPQRTLKLEAIFVLHYFLFKMTIKSNAGEVIAEFITQK